jgi:hypothetical protein
VSLKTFDGAIEIRSWDRPEVSIEIEKRAVDQEALDAIQIVSEQTGNKVTFEATYPKRASDVVHIGFYASPTVRLVVSIPRESNLVVNSGDGALVIDRVTGRLDLRTADGAIKCTEIGGDLKVHSGDGAIALEDITGSADVATGDGGVRLSGKLRGLRVGTGDGSVWIHLDDGSAMDGDWEVKTGDGSVTFELPPVFDADFDAQTSDGHVRLQNLDMAAARDAHALKGRIGAGGRTLRLRTNDGTITIKRGR